MKYLKYFENKSFGSISTVDILQDLKDMCLELVDNGFEVEVTETSILVQDDYEQFKFGEVREYFSRVVEYLIELDIISNIRIYNGHWVRANEESDKEDETLIVGAKVEYDLLCVAPVVTPQHIKEYKLYESHNNDKLDTIKDICIELEHDGFSLSIEEHDKSQNYLLDIGQGLNGWYSLVIQKRDNESPGNNMWRSVNFKINEVSDVIWRLVDYLDKGVLSIYVLVLVDGKYTWKIYVHGGPNITDEIDKVMDSDIKCKGVEIKFEL